MELVRRRLQPDRTVSSCGDAWREVHAHVRSRASPLPRYMWFRKVGGPITSKCDGYTTTSNVAETTNGEGRRLAPGCALCSGYAPHPPTHPPTRRPQHLTSPSCRRGLLSARPYPTSSFRQTRRSLISPQGGAGRPGPSASLRHRRGRAARRAVPPAQSDCAAGLPGRPSAGQASG